MDSSKNDAELMKEQMNVPIGTYTFEYEYSDLTNKEVKGGVIFKIVSGQQAFIIERTDDLNINFFYSSPGTGTSVATIDLNPLPQFNRAFFCFSWSPEKITLNIGPRGNHKFKLITAEGIPSKRQIRIGNDGSIFFIGDENVTVKDISIYQGGKEVLTSTAIESWENIKSAIEILGRGKIENDYDYECVVTNLSLSTMVTGFESYLKKRFLEIEDEGISPNIDNLFDSFLSPKEKENHVQDIMIEEAKDLNISILKYIVKKRRINFQNFDDFKKAYKQGYNLTLASAINSKLIAPIKEFLVFRHRIIHITPLLMMLNQPEVPPNEPVFPNESLKLEALEKFDEFIQLFHYATLKLEKTD